MYHLTMIPFWYLLIYKISSFSQQTFVIKSKIAAKEYSKLHVDIIIGLNTSLFM